VENKFLMYTPQQATDFKRIFKVDIADFWSPMMKFDLQKFDLLVVRSNNAVSIASKVLDIGGLEGLKLINNLWGIGHDPRPF